MTIATMPNAVAQPKPQPAPKPKKPAAPNPFANWFKGVAAKIAPTVTPAERAEIAARKAQARAIKLKTKMLMGEAQHAAQIIAYVLDDLNVSHRQMVKGHEKTKRISYKNFVLTEEALYLPVDLGPRKRPRGVGIGDLSNEEILKNLSGAVGRKVEARYNERIGFVYIVWRDQSARGIPNHVKYDDIITLKPVSNSPLTIPLGMGEGKKDLWHSFNKFHSMAVYGSSGGGKSNFINVALSTLVNQCSPRMLRLALVDYKRTELGFYKKLPHVLKYEIKGDDGDPVEKTAFAVDAEAASDLFTYLTRELNRRINLLEDAHVRKLSEYNAKNKTRPLPWILLVADEWADIAEDPKIGKRCLDQLASLARMGRAYGIGLMVCTQTPGSKILPSVVRNNLLATVSFNVANMHAAINISGNKGAFRLSEQPGRFMYQIGQTQLEVQAPLITNDKVDEILESVIKGKRYHAEIQSKHDVSDVEILEWAISKNDGHLTLHSILNQYRTRGMTERAARSFMENYYGQTVDIFGVEYYVRRGGQGVNTRLIPLTEMSEKSGEK